MDLGWKKATPAEGAAVSLVRQRIYRKFRRRIWNVRLVLLETSIRRRVRIFGTCVHLGAAQK